MKRIDLLTKKGYDPSFVEGSKEEGILGFFILKKDAVREVGIQLFSDKKAAPYYEEDGVVLSGEIGSFKSAVEEVQYFM